jgi:hypothetical protein
MKKASTERYLAAKRRSIVQRWTPVLLQEGFTPVANTFLDYYSLLRPPLRPREVCFLVHLLRYKWDERAPFPGYASIARRMDLGISSVRAIARSLEEKGYIVREFRTGQTNRFRLEPLYHALEKVVVARANRTSYQQSRKLSRI